MYLLNFLLIAYKGLNAEELSPFIKMGAFVWFPVILGILVRFIFFVFEYTPLRRYGNRLWLPRNLDREYIPFIRSNFPFYNALNDKDKHLFERRVQKFIDMKRFIPRGGIGEITFEMKALIAGSAIQLTFGYPDIYFRHFWRVLVYPDNYYSTITRKYHKGEVNLGGLIVVSWKHLKHGFSDQGDGSHLGLHEMAHALRLINIIDNPEYDFYDREILAAFDGEAKMEIRKLMETPDSESIFRHYATTNLHEFFAVSVEIFFEKPVEFRNYNPVLYSLLSRMLKINPASY